ncbi:MAG: glycerophosphodiester phosphodiesterase family protein [Gammaproteobacteria bacterium]
MLIIAHRGASGEAPENTLAAFDLAWRQQADGIELDVRLSRDGRVMVHHDPTTKRLTGTDLSIADSTSDALRQLDFGIWKGPEFAGQRMPVLDEVLAAAPPGKQVVIEIKCGPEIIPALSQVLKNPANHAAQLAVSLISFNLDTLIACQQSLPEIPCLFLQEADASTTNGFSADLITLALEQGFAGLDLDYKGLTETFAAQVRQAGLHLLTWTVNELSQLAHLRACGVEGITTDWPLQFLNSLQQVGEHS